MDAELLLEKARVPLRLPEELGDRSEIVAVAMMATLIGNPARLVLVKIGTRTDTPPDDLLRPLFAPIDLDRVPLEAGKVTSGLGLDRERFFQSFGLERGPYC